MSIFAASYALARRGDRVAQLRAAWPAGLRGRVVLVTFENRYQPNIEE